MSETLAAFLDSVTAAEPQREAVAYAPGRRVSTRMSRAELRQASRRAARRLIGLGVGKGTRFGFLCSNRLEWLPIAFGALRLGAVLVPFSTLWKREELAYGLRHGDVQTLLTMPGFLKHDYLASLHDIVPELRTAPPGQVYSDTAPQLRRVVVLEGDGGGLERWDDLPEIGDDAFVDALGASVAPSDWATIFFTSGTTAQAKAVVHSHAALAVSGRRIAASLGINAGDAWWGHMPLFWSGGFILGALATLAGGARAVLHESVEAGAALELLDQEHCTIMAGWHQAGPLLEHPDFDPQHIHLNKGSNHPLAVRLMGPSHHAVGMYGMSETATCVACARWDDEETVRTETFGRPLEGMVVRIVDPESRQVVANGTTGEILVKGPTLMEGYYKVARAETFDGEGFFKTGDLGYLDDQGCLHFATRLKDVIKTAGVNVAAVEVEDALQRHPSVKAAYVVGVTHAVRGENIAALIVAQDNQPPPSPEQLLEFCKQNLASYKVPKHFLTIADAEVPRTGSGKVEKPTLRKLAEARISAG